MAATLRAAPLGLPSLAQYCRPRVCHVSATAAAVPFEAGAAAAAASASRPSSVIRKIQKELASGARSAVDVAEEYLGRLSQHQDTLNSFTFWDPSLALDQAREVDRQLQGHERDACLKRPLLGVPLGIKDNICSKDMPASAGSKILAGYRPPYDAAAVEKLREHGGVLLGKTNMDEFGMGSSNEQSAFGAARNPWANDRVPGGSSGGSGAAVAAGQCAVALGSDTGGSVRQPASFCGVVGLKPSYGRVSRWGLMAYASSLDVIGCMAPSVEDAAIVLSAIAGGDPRDSTSISKAVPDFTLSLRQAEVLPSRPLEGVRLGVIEGTMGVGVDQGVVSCVNIALTHLKALGAVVEEVSLPSFPLGLPAYYILAASEASSNLSRYDGLRFGLSKSADSLSDIYCSTRGEGFGTEVKRRILMGTYALSAGFYDAYYKRAQQVRTFILNDFNNALTKFDALVTPTAPTPAFKIGEKTRDPLAMYAGDLMTVNVNLAGLPALSVPCGFAPVAGNTSDGGTPVQLPVGLQLIGQSMAEADILKLGHIYEQTATTWSPLQF